MPSTPGARCSRYFGLSKYSQQQHMRAKTIRRISERIWELGKDTRIGQCAALLVFGMFFSILATLRADLSSTTSRAILPWCLLIGPAIGLLLILILVVPSIYREYIKKRQANGQGVLLHRMLLVLYFFPFLTFVFFGAIGWAILTFSP